ncbi:MAG: 16S rRNA (cytidine(1402)-2'-O)-methyltransferase [Patescibacteria group bacterium]|nr:16S rRNA (cytidine(1402)-2'-O)-methyltransferase [Patescibacteria group bacterium]
MGTLHIVATPIGNLGDITLRALEVLDDVDLIASEDTRVTKKLLDAYKINTPLVSYHAHSKSNKTKGLLERLHDGNEIALVTDAGTPGIQDPAGELVNFAHQKGINVVSIPGPSALTATLSIAGIPADSFYFVGFLPKKKGRQTKFKHLANIPDPVVIYESPYRVVRTLEDIKNYLGDRVVIIGREITKKFEELLRNNVDGMIKHFNENPPKGEFVIIVMPNNE